MSCALFMTTICTHDMIPSSTLHLRTTSLLALIHMIACFVASPMLHSYLLSWVDDIYVHASHMIHLVHCRLPPIVASMFIDLGDLDILLVMHACLIKSIVFGWSCIICPLLWNASLSFLIMSMMHTLVGYLTTRMLGFAFTLSSSVFTSVCHVLSFWRIHKAVTSRDNLVMWRHTRCATPSSLRTS